MTCAKPPQRKMTFVTDKEKAALNGITTEQIASTLEALLAGETVGLVRSDTERNPLRIELRVPEDRRTSAADLAKVQVKGSNGQLVPLAELGQWETARVDQMIYHKNLQRVAYVFAETAGRPPADVVVDILADQNEHARWPPTKLETVGNGWIAQGNARPVAERTFFSNGSHLAWGVPAGFTVDFAGEGEWKITLDVFRDLGLAFGAAMIAIYVLLVAQTGSFAVPVVVMLAIPLTILGVMPGFWLLNSAERPTGGRFPRSRLLHGHGHDRHDRPGGHRHSRLDHSGGLHPPVAGSRSVSVRRDHGEPSGASAADPADRLRRDARRSADHHRPDLLRPGLVADLRPVCLDALYAVCDSGGLLAAVCQQAGPRDAAVVDGARGINDRAGDGRNLTIDTPPGRVPRSRRARHQARRSRTIP